MIPGSAYRYAVPQHANTAAYPMRSDQIVASQWPAFRGLAVWEDPSVCRPKLWRNPPCCCPEMFCFLPAPLQRHPAIYHTVFLPDPDNPFPTE